MNAKDLNYYKRKLRYFNEFAQERNHEGAIEVIRYVVSAFAENVFAFEEQKTNGLVSNPTQDELNAIIELLLQVQQNYPFYFPKIDLNDISSIKAYHQKNMEEEMFLEYNEEDDDEWGEYDEEAELDMMFPNREDDDWDDY